MSKKNEIKVGDIIRFKNVSKYDKQPVYSVVLGVDKKSDQNLIYSCIIQRELYSTNNNNNFILIPGFSIEKRKLEFLTIGRICINKMENVTTTGKKLNNKNIGIIAEKMLKFSDQKDGNMRIYKWCLDRLNEHLKKEHGLSKKKVYIKNNLKTI